MPKRTTRKERQDRRGIWAIVVAALFVALLVVVSLMTKSITLDANLCPEDSEALTGQIAVVLDPTDSLTSSQMADAMAKLLPLLESAPEYTKISLFNLSENEFEPTHNAFHVCMPLNPDRIRGLKTLYINRRLAEGQFEEDFRGPLGAKVESLLSGGGATASPLLKAIQHVSVDPAFQSTDSTAPRQIIFVSDMVQHSDDLSFFRDPIDFLFLTESRDYPTIRTQLSDVNIMVFLLARRGQAGLLQARPMKDFWNEYFIDQGANEPEWESVIG